MFAVYPVVSIPSGLFLQHASLGHWSKYSQGSGAVYTALTAHTQLETSMRGRNTRPPSYILTPPSPHTHPLSEHRLLPVSPSKSAYEHVLEEEERVTQPHNLSTGTAVLLATLTVAACNLQA